MDNATQKTVMVTDELSQAVVTYYKNSGDFLFKVDGEEYNVSRKEIQSFQERQFTSNDSDLTIFSTSLLSWGSNRDFIASEDINSLGYKKYYDNDTNSIYWKLNGPGIFNSREINEADCNFGKVMRINEFVKNVDKSAEYWEVTKGALIGASASAAVAAGGSYYVSCSYYKKAETAYGNI